MTRDGYGGDPILGTFAATLFYLLGVLNVTFGLAMLTGNFEDLNSDGAWLLDLSSTGWVTLVFGAIQLLVGWGVMSNRNWARVTGIAVAGIAAVHALLLVPVYPFWGLAAFSLTVLMIYALTPHRSV